MATIPSTTNQLRHVRKTINFDGTANNGRLGDVVPAFTVTGRVVVPHYTVCVTAAMACSAPEDVGIFLVAGSGEILYPPISMNFDFTATTGIFGTNAGGYYYIGDVVCLTPKDDGGNLVLGYVVGGDIGVDIDNMGMGADITDGTIVIDMWYSPITNDGALSGDDIDAGYMPADVKAWLGAAAATPTVAGVPEVDVTHFNGTAGTIAAGIPEVKIASIANGAVTAAAIATDAVDADALSADALTEIFNKVWTTALTEAYNVDGAAPTGAQALFLLMQCLTEFAISGTTLTVKKLDGSTTAMTFTLDSASAPTSRTRAT